MARDNGFDIHIEGDVSGQIVAGHNNTVVSTAGATQERVDTQNSATGSTTGHSIQAGTIRGDIHFYRPGKDAEG